MYSSLIQSNSRILLVVALIRTCCHGHDPEETECPHKTDIEIFSPKYQIIPGTPFRAWRTLPSSLFTIGPSPIPQAGMGVFANTFIHKNTWLGEYEGEFLNLKQGDEADSFEYTWRVNTDGNVKHYVDAGNASLSNWLRFVNCARHVTEENVDMHTCYGHVMYRTSLDIAPGQELLVYYGDDYAENELGINTKLYNNREFACVIENSCKDLDESMNPKRKRTQPLRFEEYISLTEQL